MPSLATTMPASELTPVNVPVFARTTPALPAAEGDSNRSPSVPVKPATGRPVSTVRSSGCSGSAATASVAASADAGTALLRASPLPSVTTAAETSTPSPAMAPRTAGPAASDVACCPMPRATCRASTSAPSLSLVERMCSTIVDSGGDSTDTSSAAPATASPLLGSPLTVIPRSDSIAAKLAAAASVGSAERRSPSGSRRPPSTASAVTGATTPAGMYVDRQSGSTAGPLNRPSSAAS